MAAPGATRDEEIEVARCSRADRAEQARLYAACFKKPLPSGGLEWRYDASPAGESVSLVARASDGLAISGYACSPRDALVGGDERTLATVGETGDVMTHPQWRKRGFFSRLDRAAMDEARRRGWALAFGLPNRRSAHIFLELGWERIGSVRPHLFVLRADDTARDARGKDGRWKRWTTGFEQRRCARARNTLGARAGTFHIERVERFDARATALARAVEPRFGFMVRRSAEYLNWRFLDTPSGLHRAFALLDGATLAAYVVVQVPRAGERSGFLVDVLARDEAGLAAALETGLTELARTGASVVEATALEQSWWAQQLVRAGFAPRGDEHALSVILHPLQDAHPLVAAARDTSKWYFTDGDRDDETVG
ncbi:MAG: GNAT family N-acetyltransferase [Planctomycetes bacterium]|nr:GNAT family N-acetyltransferase [Planctomycetota bacterium]